MIEADDLYTVLTKVVRQVSRLKGSILKGSVGGGGEVRLCNDALNSKAVCNHLRGIKLLLSYSDYWHILFLSRFENDRCCLCSWKHLFCT